MTHCACDSSGTSSPKHERWTLKDAQTLFAMPFIDLLHPAQTIHRQNFAQNEVQVSTQLSIKTGSCSENRESHRYQGPSEGDFHQDFRCGCAQA